MSKSNLVRPLRVECLPGQIREVLCGQAVEEVEMIRRLEISSYSLSCVSLSGLYLHLISLYRLTHLHT